MSLLGPTEFLTGPKRSASTAAQIPMFDEVEDPGKKQRKAAKKEKLKADKEKLKRSKKKKEKTAGALHLSDLADLCCSGPAGRHCC